MFETSKHGNRAAPDFHRASPEFRNACGRNRWTHKLVHGFGLAAVVVCCWTGYAAAGDVPVTSTAPIKIAVFAFELEDFSAAAEHGSSPIETSYLAQSTGEAKQQLLQSGRYSLITTAGADIGAAKGQGLRSRYRDEAWGRSSPDWRRDQNKHDRILCGFKSVMPEKAQLFPVLRLICAWARTTRGSAESVG
jgi:hypothetical protein